MTSSNSSAAPSTPLLDYSSFGGAAVQLKDELYYAAGHDEEESIKKRIWIESKKLWHIVGPAIFSRIASFSMFIITQAFAGHLGDLDLAALSIATNVIFGFDFGLLLGMASALETLCGQAYGAKNYRMLGIYLQRSWIVLFICCIILLPIYLLATPILKLLGQPDDVAELSGVVSMYLIPLHFCLAFSFPLQRFLQSQLKNAVIAWVTLMALVVHVVVSYLVVYKFQLGLIGTTLTLNLSWWVIVLALFGYTVFGGLSLGLGFLLRHYLVYGNLSNYLLLLVSCFGTLSLDLSLTLLFGTLFERGHR